MGKKSRKQKNKMNPAELQEVKEQIIERQIMTWAMGQAYIRNKHKNILVQSPSCATVIKSKKEIPVGK